MGKGRRIWFLIAAPLLWAAPLALGLSAVRVYMTEDQANLAISAAWVAFLAPLVAAIVAFAKLRPIGLLAILWLLLNSLAGLASFAFMALVSFQT